MKKKIFAIMLTATLTISMLAGCGEVETQEEVQKQTGADKTEMEVSKAEPVESDTGEYNVAQEYLKDTNESNNTIMDIVSDRETVLEDSDNNTNDYNNSSDNINDNNDDNNDNNNNDDNNAIGDSNPVSDDENNNSNNNISNNNNNNTSEQQPEQTNPSVSDQPAQPDESEDFDGYDRFGNKFVAVFTDSNGSYNMHVDADNPYKLDTYEWTADDKGVSIIKDLGCYDDSENWKEIDKMAIALDLTLAYKWDEKNSYDNRASTSMAIDLGCYNGHWILKLLYCAIDDADKYTSDVLFYNKNGNPWSYKDK